MMRKKTFFIAIALTFSCIITFSAFGQSSRWKKTRVEYLGGIGVSNFLGDLGGSDALGTNGVRDLNVAMTRPAIFIGYRYQVHPSIYVRGNIGYSRINGDDAQTSEIYRQQRALKFRSPVVELSARAEYMLFKDKSSGSKGLIGIKNNGKSSKGFGLNAYVFAGIGGIWYNPRAEYNGAWYSLRKLNTEGQGLPGGADPYSGMTVVLPYGLGLKMPLDRRSIFSLGLDFTAYKTFTDYLDDVSGVYYDNNDIKLNYGNEAAYFANPNGINTGSGEAGQQRGDATDKDAYMTVHLTLGYKIRSGRGKGRARTLPKF